MLTNLRDNTRYHLRVCGLGLTPGQSLEAAAGTMAHLRALHSKRAAAHCAALCLRPGAALDTRALAGSRVRGTSISASASARASTSSGSGSGSGDRHSSGVIGDGETAEGCAPLFVMPYAHLDVLTQPGPLPSAPRLRQRVSVGGRYWLQVTWDRAPSATPNPDLIYVVEEWWSAEPPRATDAAGVGSGSGSGGDGDPHTVDDADDPVSDSRRTCAAVTAEAFHNAAPPSLAPPPTATGVRHVWNGTGAGGAGVRPDGLYPPGRVTVTGPMEAPSSSSAQWRVAHRGRFPECGLGWYPAGARVHLRVRVGNRAGLGPAGPTCRLRLPAPRTLKLAVVSVWDSGCSLALRLPKWVFESGVAVAAVPAAPSPRQVVAPAPPVVPTCCSPPLDHCWYPHWDPAEDRTYYYQPSSRRTSWDPVADAAGDGGSHVVLVPPHAVYLEVFSYRHQVR
jgi:hypothetical protein